MTLPVVQGVWSAKTKGKVLPTEYVIRFTRSVILTCFCLTLIGITHRHGLGQYIFPVIHIFYGSLVMVANSVQLAHQSLYHVNRKSFLSPLLVTLSFSQWQMILSKVVLPG